MVFLSNHFHRILYPLCGGATVFIAFIADTCTYKSRKSACLCGVVLSGRLKHKIIFPLRLTLILNSLVSSYKDYPTKHAR
jgi:hypothetical protein